MEKQVTFNVLYSGNTKYWRVRFKGGTVAIFTNPRDAFSFCFDNRYKSHMNALVHPAHIDNFRLN